MHRDTLFYLLLWSTFVFAPLGGIAAIAVMIGLWRRRAKAQ